MLHTWPDRRLPEKKKTDRGSERGRTPAPVLCWQPNLYDIRWKTFTSRCPTNSRHQIQLLEAFKVHLVFGIWMVIIQQYRLIVSSDRSSSLQCINSLQPVFFLFYTATGHRSVTEALNQCNATQTLQLFNTDIKTISRQYWQSKYFQATLAIRLVPKPVPNSFPGILPKTAGYKKITFYHSLNTGSAL